MKRRAFIVMSERVERRECEQQNKDDSGEWNFNKNNMNFLNDQTEQD